MNWSGITHKLVSLGVVALSLVGLTSCGGEGGDGDEIVHLYVFNGYAGSKSMSLYGPSGKVVTGLGYGQRTAEPIAVDRNLGTNFKLVVDGSPQTINTNFTLFSLYPHETGTLLFKKRTGQASASATIYRHVQSRSSQCRLVFDNALSLDNEGLGQFGYIPLFEMPDSASGGYNRSTDGIDRSPLYNNAIDPSLHFALVPHFRDPSRLMLVHAGIGTRIDHMTGEILTYRPTEDFNDCLGEDPITNAERCLKPVTYTTHVYHPSAEEQHWVYYEPGSMGTPNSCNTSFRISSDFTNIFDAGSGPLINQKVQFPSGTHLFWILYGRPVTPDVLSFYPDDADTPFAELPPYPGE